MLLNGSHLYVEALSAFVDKTQEVVSGTTNSDYIRGILLKKEQLHLNSLYD